MEGEEPYKSSETVLGHGFDFGTQEPSHDDDCPRMNLLGLVQGRGRDSESKG